MTTITKTLLRRKGACADQIDKFVELFPEGVVVTETLCIEHASVFSWDWAASHLLSPPAFAEYNRVTAAALAEYVRVRAAARDEYVPVRVRMTAAARDEYDRVIAAAFAEYVRVTAATFGRLAEKE